MSYIVLGSSATLAFFLFITTWYYRRSVQHSTVQYSTVQYSTVQYSTVLPHVGAVQYFLYRHPEEVLCGRNKWRTIILFIHHSVDQAKNSSGRQILGRILVSFCLNPLKYKM